MESIHEPFLDDMEREHFLSKTAHEIRGPLNSLLLAAELLEADDLTVEERAGALRTIREGVATLSAVAERVEHRAQHQVLDQQAGHTSGS